MGQKKPPQQGKLEIAWEGRQLCRAGPEVENLLKMSQQCALEAMKAKTRQAASAQSSQQLLPSSAHSWAPQQCVRPSPEQEHQGLGHDVQAGLRKPRLPVWRRKSWGWRGIWL